jgi:hypothetical protein
MITQVFGVSIARGFGFGVVRLDVPLDSRKLTNRKAKRQRCKARRRERFAAKRAAALAVWQAEVKARMASARDAMLAEGWTPCPACGVLSLGSGCMVRGCDRAS